MAKFPLKTSRPCTITAAKPGPVVCCWPLTSGEDLLLVERDPLHVSTVME